MSCKIEYVVKSTMIALSSPLLRLKHELGATLKMCIVRSHLKNSCLCGVLGVSGDGIDQARILAAGSMQGTIRMVRKSGSGWCSVVE